MQKKLLFFVNPRAGHSEIRGSLMQVIQIFTAGGYEVTVHPTSAPRDLTRQIEKRAADFDLVVCTGGDGTLNEAVSGLMQLPPSARPYPYSTEQCSRFLPTAFHRQRTG